MFKADAILSSSVYSNVYCPSETPPGSEGIDGLRTHRIDIDDLDASARTLLNRLPSIDVLKLVLEGEGKWYKRGFEMGSKKCL